MSDFNEMVKQYTIKNHRKINTLTAPLKQWMGNCAFSYSRTEQDGRYFTISDHPEILEIYYGENLHLQDPYCAHPDLIRSGTLLIPDFYRLPHLEPVIKCIKVQHVFIIVKKTINAVESFYFDTFMKDQINPNIFSTNLELLHEFINYFKREAKSLLEEMRNDGFDIKKGACCITPLLFNAVSFLLSFF
jgi:hypothetical protein